MAKKSIADMASAAVEEVLGASDAQGMQGAQVTQDVPKVELRTERLYFKVSPTVKDYLRKAAYDASTPARHVSMTDYVCMLIEKDMQEHGEA